MKVQPDGYAIIPRVLTQKQIVELKAEIRQLIGSDSAYGIRQIDRHIPAISQLAYSSSIIKHLNYSDRHNGALQVIPRLPEGYASRSHHQILNSHEIDLSFI